MPIPPAVQGFTGLTQQTRLCIENNPGEQLLMPQTTGAATMSLTTQPNAAGAATTGMQLHFYIIGNAGTGTIGIVGTKPGGGGVTSQTYHINPAPLNSQGYSEFTTSEVFLTVTAASITLSAGLLPCQVMIFGSPAGKFLLPITADAEEMITKFAPQDKRGILMKNVRVVQTIKGATLGKFDATLYPDSLWLLYMLVTSNPVVTTVPAAPTSLLAATVIAATMTLTTSLATVPPGEFLIFTPGGNSVAGTIVLNGKDPFGNTYATSETITVGANNNVVYSQRRYSALTVPGANQFTTTGMTVGSTLAVTGAFAFTFTGTWDGLTNTTTSSASLELFDGVMGVKLPFTIFTDGTFDWQKEKEVLFSGKGEAQDYLIVGDPNPTTYPSGTNPFATLAQPTSLPVVAWPGQFFVDPLPTNAPFTSQDGSFLTFKAQILTGLKPYYTGDGMQRWSLVMRQTEPDFLIDATLVLQNYQYYVNYFKQNQRIACGAIFQGNLLGSLAGTTYYENMTWTFPAKIDTFKPDRATNPTSGILKIMSEYDFVLGYGYKLSMTAQVAPTYTV